MYKVLRIKKIYFEKILSGEKVFEYRSIKPYYDFLKDKDLTHLIFHYQGRKYLKVTVISVRKIKRPKSLEKSQIYFTPKVYKIGLSNPRLIDQIQ